MATEIPRSPAELPLGWQRQQYGRTIGFTHAASATDRRERLVHTGPGHLLTVAPTGAGKGRSGVIPTLLTYPGPTLTIDLKEENYAVTAARRRRRLGHRVVALDPFRIVVSEPDALNPFDLFTLPGAEADCESELLAELLCGGQPISSKDLFWELTPKGLITGLIGLAAESHDPTRRTTGAVLDFLLADDADYGIAVRLDTHKFANQLARQELAAYLQHEGDRCRPSIRSTAQAMVKCLGSRAVRAALDRTSFDLGGWLRGEPLDIFLIFFPDKLDSHRALLRLWLGTLLAVLLRRSAMPADRTLLLLDEAVQLGSLRQLRTALTLLRGYGVQMWTFWQDLSQLKHLYPSDWETVVNNSAVLQVFGPGNGCAARSLADLLGVRPDELMRLEPREQVLLRPGGVPETVQRVDYLTDPEFAGLFDPNPRYVPAPRR